MSNEDAPRGIEFSPDDLSPEALRGLIEEFVTRDGTDYGASERSLEEKVRRLRSLLDSGDASIVYDHASESVTIVSAREL